MTNRDERENEQPDRPGESLPGDTGPADAESGPADRPGGAPSDQAGEASGASSATPDAAGEPPDRDPPRAGGIRYQDPATTVPREPTLAERRARQQAEKQRAEDERLALLEDERRRRRRKRILIGTGVTVGVVALVAVGYSVVNGEEDTTARCVDANDVVVDDSNCVTPAASNGYTNHGPGFIPIFIGAGGGQYHYYYGGSGDNGQRATGGTTAAPSKGTTTTRSGTSVSRGGLGVSGGGSSSGS